MNPSLKYPGLGRQTIFTTLIVAGFFLMTLLIFEPLKKAEADLVGIEAKEILVELNDEKLIFIQGNTLSSILIPLNPSNPEPETIRKIRVIITGYSSSFWETDEDPYLTAAGTEAREGIVANNLLAFGIKVRIPELFGERIFVVEDRMNSKKGPYHVDIWFPSYWEAKNFGAKITYLEILKN